VKCRQNEVKKNVKEKPNRFNFLKQKTKFLK